MPPASFPHAQARGVYLITPDETDTARLLAQVQPLLGAGVPWLQYRNKLADAALRLEHEPGGYWLYPLYAQR